MLIEKIPQEDLLKGAQEFWATHKSPFYVIYPHIETRIVVGLEVERIEADGSIIFGDPLGTEFDINNSAHASLVHKTDSVQVESCQYVLKDNARNYIDVVFNSRTEL